MSDDERIEQLELEVKVLQDNNKGLKEKNKELSDSYDKLAKECNEENRRCMLLAVENQDLKDKIKEKIEELKREKAIYYYEWRHLEANVINKIQEYDDKGMTVNLVNRSAGKTFQQAVHYEVKKVLQSLLDKE